MKKLYAGDNAPDFTMPCVLGDTFTLSSETKERPVLLYFYPANYGMICTFYSEAMNDYFNDFEGLGIKVFHVNDASVEGHTKWMDRLDSKYDHISDIEQNVSRAYGMIVNDYDGPGSIINRGFVLIDKNMVIRYVWKAEMPVNTCGLRELLTDIRRAMKRA